MTFYFRGSGFDLQKSITGNIPSFLSTGKYPGEFHIPGYSFAG